MKRLIVNADDFGLTVGVCNGIVEAHERGIVSSTTLMANGSAFDAAAALRRQVPGLGLGVHLNLTSGRPVSPPPTVPTLVDRDGSLCLSPGRLLKALITKTVSLREVERELRAQITKVVDAGILPSHLDGHKHIHVLPGVAAIVVRLAQEFSIRSVRCPMERASRRTLRRLGAPRLPVLKQYLVGRAVSRFAAPFAETLAKEGRLFPASFFGLSETGFLEVEALGEILEDLPEGDSELMCHPGHIDQALVETGTRLLRQREVEVQALTAPRILRTAAERQIELIRFDQIATRVYQPALRPNSNASPTCATRVELLEPRRQQQ